jgi:DNA-binding CsgD family transcriptional regulator
VPLVVYRVQQGLLDEALALELLCTPGRERDAAHAFLRAASLHDRYLRRNAVRCRWAAGEALLGAGSVDEATSMLEATRITCEVHGMLPLLRRVQASLRRAGSIPRTTPTGPSRDRTELTPREREVLDLVRDGLSTVEIAARLRVRPSTVDSHIRKSVKRLGASNRREAALLAQRTR